MRLRDIGRGDEPLPAEIEAELDALDAALSGEPVPPGMEGLETLVNDMRAERAAPDDEFGAALDHWAAAGFPRGRQPRLSEEATKSDAGGRARMFLASLTPRKLAYAGGAAATLVVLVVGVSQIDFESQPDRGDSSGASAEINPEETQADDAGGDAAVAPAVADEGADITRGDRAWERLRSGFCRRSPSRPAHPAASPAASRSARSSVTRR